MTLDMRVLSKWDVYIHDKGMMVPGVLGKYGRAFDMLSALSLHEQRRLAGNDAGFIRITQYNAFLVSRVLTNYLQGL